MNSGEVGSVGLWLSLKVCELSRATTVKAGGTGFGLGLGSAAVRKPPALLRGDRVESRMVGALRARPRASYTCIFWIRHISGRMRARSGRGGRGCSRRDGGLRCDESTGE